VPGGVCGGGVSVSGSWVLEVSRGFYFLGFFVSLGNRGFWRLLWVSWGFLDRVQTFLLPIHNTSLASSFPLLQNIGWQNCHGHKYHPFPKFTHYLVFPAEGTGVGRDLHSRHSYELHARSAPRTSWERLLSSFFFFFFEVQLHKTNNFKSNGIGTQQQRAKLTNNTKLSSTYPAQYIPTRNSSHLSHRQQKVRQFKFLTTPVSA
jgi:hypothetical protein